MPLTKGSQSTIFHFGVQTGFFLFEFPICVSLGVDGNPMLPTVSMESSNIKLNIKLHVIQNINFEYTILSLLRQKKNIKFICLRLFYISVGYKEFHMPNPYYPHRGWNKYLYGGNKGYLI